MTVQVYVFSGDCAFLLLGIVPYQICYWDMRLSCYMIMLGDGVQISIKWKHADE